MRVLLLAALLAVMFTGCDQKAESVEGVTDPKSTGISDTPPVPGEIVTYKRDAPVPAWLDDRSKE